jgi:hypothetical protein
MSASEVIENVIDEAATIAEEAVDILEKSPFQLTRRQHRIRLLVVGAVAGGLGGAASYYICNRKLKTKYEKLAAQEIEEAKKFYNVLHKNGKLSTPEKAVDELIPSPEVVEAAGALLTYQGKNASEPTEVEVNVFTESKVDDNFDYEEEMKSRTPELPYIISHDEFVENETNFSQSSITYYEGDGALADERDQEIPFVDPVIGEGNLRFGHGSGDSRVVYIRNERLSAEYEVLKSDGKYAHEVLGLEHSYGSERDYKRRNDNRKFRGDDE